MRITPFIIFNRMVRSFQTSYQNLSNAHERLSTGKRINRPSDDVVGFSKAMRYRESINANERYGKNIDEAIAQLGFTDVIMQSATQTIIRAQELTIQAISGIQNVDTRHIISEEMSNLKDTLLGLANSERMGRYVFSGYRTDTPAFDSAGNYQGDAGIMEVAVDRGSRMAVNIPGDEVFGYTISAEETVQIEGRTVLEGSDITAPGTAQTLEFTIKGRLGVKTITVDILAGDSNAAIATKIITAVNNEKNNTGVEAKDGGGGIAVDLFDDGAGDIVVSGIELGGDEDLWSGFPEGTTTQEKGQYYIHYIPGAGTTVNVEIRDIDDITVIDSFTFDNVIQVTDLLTSALQSQNVLRIRALLDPLGESLQQLVNAQADVGARLNHLDSRADRFADGTLILRTSLSGVEDADIAEAAGDMVKAETALMALRETTSRVISQSLMDFLR